MLSPVREGWGRLRAMVGAGGDGVARELFDVGHISGETKRGRLRGGHFVEKDEELDGCRVVTNPQTGVRWAQRPDGKGGVKTSSFFPPGINSPEAVLRLVQGARTIAVRGSRTLSVAGDAAHPIYCVGMRWDSVDLRIFNSFYPPFSFDLVDPSFDGSFAGGLVKEASPGQVFELAMAYLEPCIRRGSCGIWGNSQVKFFAPASGLSEELLVFDFAPYVQPTINVDCGVFVAFPVGQLRARVPAADQPSLERVLAELAAGGAVAPVTKV
jgi:hypothetical protein